MLSTLPFTRTGLQGAYSTGVTPTAVIDEIFARLDAVGDPAIFIHLRAHADLVQEAEALGPYDASKPLWGIPFAVKDNIDVAGIETTAACPSYAYTPREDAFVVAKLRAAGALMIGKTNLDQFATGLVGVRSPYGVPRNSIDPDIVPGGSSSGSAVVVGHGIVTFSLGTDTAGSGRVPAALNNIVGLKPTLGALSATGVVPACRTLDTISIFALSVDDAYAAFAVARGYDGRDAFSKHVVHEDLTAPPAKLRIGVPSDASVEFFGDEVQRETFARDISNLRETGSEIVSLDFTPLYDIAKMLYQGAWVAERYTVIGDLLASDPESIHPVTRQIVSQAEDLSAADAFRGIYRLAELKRKAEPMLKGLDMLCVPTISTFYRTADLEADPITPNANLGTYTNFVNLLNMCAIAVPTNPRRDGRPGGVTLLADAGHDAQVAALGRSIEAGCTRTMGATKHPLPEPTTLKAAETRHIDLAVCGAHMSDLPLNWQLTNRGAEFVRKDWTAACYRFFALEGQPPARPGLVRSETPHGVSVAVEVWSIPKTALGAFIEAIPAPLGIGTIELRDGTLVKGFLCESSGVRGATDISAIADWRLYLSQEKADVTG
jgi:allophanate hydrolase